MKYIGQPDGPQTGMYGETRMTRTSDVMLNSKTVLDTLSTILSSSEWESFVPTAPLPLDDTAARVKEGLYISGFLAEQNRRELDSKGITHILQVPDILKTSFNRF